MRKYVDLTGRTFHQLKVISYGFSRKQQRYWECLCDCGATTFVPTSQLTGGNTKSCGCRKHQIKSRRTHGMTGSRAYHSWCHMRQRCNNTDNPKYKNYGGRGISICERWESFDNFYADMGDPPKYHTLDRIDNDGDYTPENCRWASQKQQANNRRRFKSNTVSLTHNGVKRPIAEWSKITGISYHTIRMRMKYGWPSNDILGCDVSPVPRHFRISPL